MNDDPGWGPALKMALRRVAFPWLARSNQPDIPRLTALRGILASIGISWVLFLVILLFLSGKSTEPTRTVVSGIVAVMGVASLTLIAALRDRGIDFSSEDRFVRTYNRAFFICFALAESAVLIGFIGFFQRGGLWSYLTGLPFGFVGFATSAPTRGNLERLRRLGSDRAARFDVLEALLKPVGKPMTD